MDLHFNSPVCEVIEYQLGCKKKKRNTIVIRLEASKSKYDMASSSKKLSAIRS